MPDVPIVEQRLLTEYDDYYYSRGEVTPLPVLRVKFGDPMGLCPPIESCMLLAGAGGGTIAGVAGGGAALGGIAAGAAAGAAPPGLYLVVSQAATGSAPRSTVCSARVAFHRASLRMRSWGPVRGSPQQDRDR